MPDNIKLPCVNCICVAICRHKLFDVLIKDCKLLLDTLYFDKTTVDGTRSKNYNIKLTMIQDILNPIDWNIRIDDDAFPYVHNFSFAKKSEAGLTNKLIRKIRKRRKSI